MPRGGIIFAVMVLFGLLSAVSVQAAKTDQFIVAADTQMKDPTIVLTRGKAETVDISGPVSDILIADPTVLDVTVLQSNKLYLVGREIGDTNMIAVDAMGNVVKRLNVHVRLDSGSIQGAIKSLFPKEDIQVNTLGGQIILSGSVSSTMVANRARDLIGRFAGDDGTVVNMMNIRGEQQVMMRVKIVEMSRTIIKQLGLQTNLNDPVDPDATDPLFGLLEPEAFAGRGTSLSGQLLTNTGISETPAALARLLRDTGINGLGTIEVLLQALEEENLLNTLAEPNLTSISGEQASFLAGGEFPVPSGIDDAGNAVFEYRPFGVTLNFRPTVLSGDRINLQLRTEVSQRNEADDAQIGTTNLPAFDVSRATTTVELSSGGSLMIAGLIDLQTVNSMSGVPGVKDMPVFGELVKSREFSRNESEVLVIVTAYLVQPFGSQEYAKKAPEARKNPLAAAFADMLKRTYAKKMDDIEPLLNDNEAYGYLID